MSTKRPDVLKAPPSPLICLTLAEMHVSHWEVRSKCNLCRTDLRVNLATMMRTLGPDTPGWGIKPKCPGYECEQGVMTMVARTIKGGSWVSLSAYTPSQRDLELWRNKRPRYLGPRD